MSTVYSVASWYNLQGGLVFWITFTYPSVLAGIENSASNFIINANRSWEGTAQVAKSADPLSTY